MQADVLILKKMGSKKRWRWGLLFTGLVVSLALLLVLFRGNWLGGFMEGPVGAEYGPEAVIENYGADFVRYGNEFGIPPEYLAALCMLESGGRKPAGSRFEKHVYNRLRLVKMGLKKHYEHVEQQHLKDAGEEAIENLSTSWGPFQLMGYKCLLYDINVADLRGPRGTYWGVKWISEAYGRYLRRKDYKSAFHYHNAGSPFPRDGKSRTHDPQYVANGLKWMNHFKGKM